MADAGLWSCEVLTAPLDLYRSPTAERNARIPRQYHLVLVSAYGLGPVAPTNMNLAAYDSQEEWWWVVECSDYIRKQHPGTSRYAVVPIGRLNQYRNILCKVRYSTEAAANAAAIAAETGTEKLIAWEVVWWPASYRADHPGTSRFEAVCQDDIRKFWPLGAKTVWGGMSRPDATHEAARRSSLPELWCAVTNENARTKEQEPYTVKSFDGLSHSEKDKVHATCESEEAAWKAIAGITEEDRRRAAAHEQQQREWANAERRKERTGVLFRPIALVAAVVGGIWLLVTVVHWFWVHPLF